MRAPPRATAAAFLARAPRPLRSRWAPQFKTQLSSLMETLNSTSPHSVRCTKPNALKKGSIFQSQMMLAQLRYAGLLEVCRIHKLGFPIRREFDGFVKRYRCMVPGGDRRGQHAGPAHGDGQAARKDVGQRTGGRNSKV
jgi:myosin heavy subunit